MAAAEYLAAFATENERLREAALGTAIERESRFRELFAQQPDSPELNDSHLLLINVEQKRETFKRVAQPADYDISRVVMPLGDQRKPAGTYPIVSHKDFLRTWDLFTEGSLRFLNWDNVFAAGGSVMACLSPISEEFNNSNVERRKYLHDKQFPGSDVDLFLYGLDEESGKRKLVEISEAIIDAIPYEVIAFRSSHAVTLVSQYPYRHIQVVLRLYKSPAEILMGFDVDACSVGFDGKTVYALPRAHHALITQANRIDMSRRSPSYEMRLAKYAERGFEVIVPSLNRARKDPQLFDRPFEKLSGLARLLVLEQLRTPDARYSFREQQRLKQMRPTDTKRGSFWAKLSRSIQSDVYLRERLEMGGADASDYSTVFLPWGPKWQASRVRKLMFKKDYILNSKWYDPKKKHHTHPCFFGATHEVLHDCCGKCPPLPADIGDDVNVFVSGPLTFMQDDPGRQRIGSFHPITEGDWSEGAYVSEASEQLGALAIDPNSAQALDKFLADGNDPNLRDYLGRTPLHLALFAQNEAGIDVLLKRGARLGERLADGRTVFHIAAQWAFDSILKKLIEANNAVKQAKAAHPSEPKKNSKGEDIKELDTLDINEKDWDGLTPLHYAVFFSRVSTTSILLENGASVNVVYEKKSDYSTTQMSLLYMLTFSNDLETAVSIATLLIKTGGASCDQQLLPSLDTVLKTLATSNHYALVEFLFEADSAKALQAAKLLNLEFKNTLSSCICNGNADIALLLLERGLPYEIVQEDLETLSKNASALTKNSTAIELRTVEQPLYLAAINGLVDVVKKIVSLGGDVTTCVGPIRSSVDWTTQKEVWSKPESLLKSVRNALRSIFSQIQSIDAYVQFLKGPHGLRLLQSHKSTYCYLISYFTTGLNNGYLHDMNSPVSLNVEQQWEAFEAAGEDSRQIDAKIRQKANTLREEIANLESWLSTTPKEDNDFIVASLEADLRRAQVELRRTERAIKLANAAGNLNDDRIKKELALTLEKAQGFVDVIVYLRQCGCKLSDEDEENASEADTRKRKPKQAEVKAEVVPMHRFGTLKTSVKERNFWRAQVRQSDIPIALNPFYISLFTAVWQGDLAKIYKLTSPEAGENRVVVCVEDLNLQQTPLSLAVARGHTHLIAPLMAIAAAQYTPEIKEGDASKPGRFNNLDLLSGDVEVQDYVDDDGNRLEGDDEEEGEGEDEDGDGEDEEDAQDEKKTTKKNKDVVCRSSPFELLAFESITPIKWLVNNITNDDLQVIKAYGSYYAEKDKDGNLEMIDEDDEEKALSITSDILCLALLTNKDKSVEAILNELESFKPTSKTDFQFGAAWTMVHQVNLKTFVNGSLSVFMPKRASVTNSKDWTLFSLALCLNQTKSAGLMLSYTGGGDTFSEFAPTDKERTKYLDKPPPKDKNSKEAHVHEWVSLCRNSIHRQATVPALFLMTFFSRMQALSWMQGPQPIAQLNEFFTKRAQHRAAAMLVRSPHLQGKNLAELIWKQVSSPVLPQKPLKNETALLVAACVGDVTVFDKLVSVCDAAQVKEAINFVAAPPAKTPKNDADEDVRSEPLAVVAAMSGHADLLSLLVAKGADLLVEDRTRGWTALHYACQEGHLDVVTAIYSLAKNKEEASAILSHPSREFGHTPLMVAAHHARHRVIRFLLQKQADLNFNLNLQKESALHIAISRSYANIVSELLPRDSKESIKGLARESAYGFTPLDVAASVEKRFMLSENKRDGNHPRGPYGVDGGWNKPLAAPHSVASPGSLPRLLPDKDENNEEEAKKRKLIGLSLKNSYYNDQTEKHLTLETSSNYTDSRYVLDILQEVFTDGTRRPTSLSEVQNLTEKLTSSISNELPNRNYYYRSVETPADKDLTSTGVAPTLLKAFPLRPTDSWSVI